MDETAKADRGMNLAAQIHGDRSLTAHRLKEAGKVLLGYMAPCVPLELLSAVDIVPFRIFGDMDEPISHADKAFPVTLCPSVRSCYDLACKGVRFPGRIYRRPFLRRAGKGRPYLEIDGKLPFFSLPGHSAHDPSLE